ncbi:uncharacterized protein FIBRA_08156 [Fibroporia radiculosa]|uniref:DUF1365 domain-containing protein n=1 Tax=Fibroporia radiculosa TaxID=599839 RepID=J4GGN1_9APHY|nr:uncharacterized protein FIBRA_08156 [Fibroporia radiculosa]CCM05918.1 predicted protein [Fibroporia radiculosa]
MIVVLIFLVSSLVGFAALWRSRRKFLGQGYILEQQVTHRRLRPRPSTHAFSYPTLFLLLSVNALESRSLDLFFGRLFGYGSIFWRLTGLRAAAYLSTSSDRTRAQSIKARLQDVLSSNGYDGNLLSDAWMMTMPSYLGFEGINPLTVYFCYRAEPALWLVVLEIHNTFGERHIHVLETGEGEDPQPALGFHHQWTFPRDFHVSPFNDRSGFYCASVTAPSVPPPAAFPENASSASISQCLPHVVIRLHLLEPDVLTRTEPGSLKITALLRTTKSAPLTSLDLLVNLLRHPLVLLVTYIRILYHAWILHYRKRLDMYVRPDPKPSNLGWGDVSVPTDASTTPSSGGVGWQQESVLEQYARRRVENYLRRRVSEISVSVTLISANPTIQPYTFEPTVVASSVCEERPQLVVWYRSSQFFTTLLLAPSAAHTLLVGHYTEHLFVTSSPDLFCTVFTADHSMPQTAPRYMAPAQALRTRRIPQELRRVYGYTIPSVHSLDVDANSQRTALMNLAFVAISLTLAWLEEMLYRAAHVRFVPGQEPWKKWERALDIAKHRDAGIVETSRKGC